MVDPYDTSATYDSAGLYDVGAGEGSIPIGLQSFFHDQRLLGASYLGAVALTVAAVSPRTNIITTLDVTDALAPVVLGSLTLARPLLAVEANAAGTHFYARSTDSLYKVPLNASTLTATYDVPTSSAPWMIALASGNFIVPSSAGALVLGPTGLQVSQCIFAISEASRAAFDPVSRYLYIHDRTRSVIEILSLDIADTLTYITEIEAPGGLAARALRMGWDATTMYLVTQEYLITYDLTDKEAPVKSDSTRYLRSELSDVVNLPGGSYVYVGAKKSIAGQIQYDLDFGEDVLRFVTTAGNNGVMFGLQSDLGRLLSWSLQ